MNNLDDFFEFLKKLEDGNIYYKLNRVRFDAIMAEVVIPGQRWEIEFCKCGNTSNYEIEIEKFLSDGKIYDVSELDVLFHDFSDY